MTPDTLPIDQYDDQLAEKTARLKTLMSPFAAPEPDVFPSPKQHYRMRAEFRVWHDEEDLFHIIFDQQTKARIRVDQFPAASELINRLMTALIDELKPLPVLRRKLFQIDYLSTRSGKIIASLLYHRKLDEEWQQAATALAAWKAAHPQQALDNAPFWMTGEAWGHGVLKSDYYQHGFDAMINFDFQDQAAGAIGCYAQIGPVYQQMAEKLQEFNVLSYLSSHDTRLFFNEDAKGDLHAQQRAAELLLLAPGAVQIYYGDESGRPFGATGSDPIQGTRSEMNWAQLQAPAHAALLAHWSSDVCSSDLQKISQFRARHPAVGAGQQHMQPDQRYFAFSRSLNRDRVLVVWAGNPAP